MPAISVTAEVASGRLRLNVSGLAAAQPFYVFRRDSSGVGVVRDTSEGTAVADGSGAAVVYDYEPRQGVSADYLLADADGQLLATQLAVLAPLWGTWVKSPGRPYLNVLVHLADEDAVVRAARRQVVYVTDSPQPVVLHERRQAAAGQVDLAVRTTEQHTALLRVLEDGAVVMLDADPTLGLAYRYVSVGDVQSLRAGGADGLGLHFQQRLVQLRDVVAVAAPIGTSVVQSGATYDQLPVLYASYAALAATVATYEDLVTGGA